MAKNPFLQDADDVATKSAMTPALQDFDESKGVFGRVQQITGSGSPLMEVARTRAQQAANSRGLRNSSMAVQAGEQAVIEAATPIASADASLYQQQTLANQNARNAAGQTNAQIRANLGSQGMSLFEQARQFDRSAGLEADRLKESSRQFDVSAGEQRRQFDAGQQQQMTLAQMDHTLQRDLTQLEFDSREAIQGSQNIANAWGTLMESISQIQNNPDLEAGAKDQLIRNNLESFRAFSSFWQKSNQIDVSDLLNFGTSPTRENAPSAPRPVVPRWEELPTNPGGL